MHFHFSFFNWSGRHLIVYQVLAMPYSNRRRYLYILDVSIDSECFQKSMDVSIDSECFQKVGNVPQ